MASPLPSFEAKIVFLGSSGVGKTCIITRATSDEFSYDMPSTVGASFTSKQVHLDDCTAHLQIWDTAGQERFRTLAPMFYRGASVGVLVFSLTDRQSLPEVRNWANEIQSHVETTPSFLLVGNKLDLKDKREVEGLEGEAMAQELNAEYYEVSAQTGFGMEDLVHAIATKAYEKVGRNAMNSATANKNVEIAKAEKKSKKCCG
jgi:small GTP-binding protein